MVRCVLFLFLFFSPLLFAERFTIDPSAGSFEMRPPQKERVDVFDFSGEFPELKNIDINARRKKNVEFYLTGDYPLLESVDYEGSFGVFKGELTGNFPKLAQVSFICTNCAMHFDLDTTWQCPCEITITGADEDIILFLPKDVGLVIHTKTGVKGKVVACEGLKKKKWYSITNKTFENALIETAPVTLTINIVAGEGHIVLN
jgi:hypothetical protein